MDGLKDKIKKEIANLLSEIDKRQKLLSQISEDDDTVSEATIFVALLCLRFGITVESLRSGARNREICYPRHIICYLLKKKYGKKLSLKKIGKLVSVSGSDHASIINSLRKTKDFITFEDEVFMQYFNKVNDL